MSVNVVTLLKIDVFKKIPADSSGRNLIPEHLDTRNVRDRPFHGHQPLAQIVIDSRICGCFVIRESGADML